jgi:hypothetical protein
MVCRNPWGKAGANGGERRVRWSGAWFLCPGIRRLEEGTVREEGGFFKVLMVSEFKFYIAYITYYVKLNKLYTLYKIN